jgi:YggT family protein
VFALLRLLVYLYLYLVMLPMALLSWFRVPYDSPLAKVQLYLHRATEPVLRPVRRVIPPVAGIDLSFIVVFLALQIVVIGVLLR